MATRKAHSFHARILQHPVDPPPTPPFVCPDSASAIAAGRAEGHHGEAHKLARILFNVMRYGLAYMKQTEAVYAKQVRERQEKQLRRRAKELGYELTKIEQPATPATPTA